VQDLTVPEEAALMAGPIPLYYQLEQRLRDRIVSNELSPGTALPTEDQIGEQYGVSRITVRRALNALQQQGLIERRHGVGSFVAERSIGMNSYLTGSLNEFLASAASLRTRCLWLGEAEPTPSVRHTFGLKSHEKALLLKTLGSLDEEGPVAFLEIWFPLEVAPMLQPETLDGKTPVIRQVEKALGLRLVRAEQIIEADRAGEEAARYLEVNADTPILKVRRVYFAYPERPIEIAYVRYHPERYRYAIEFKS
jgi:GntR family transcriptional regulator